MRPRNSNRGSSEFERYWTSPCPTGDRALHGNGRVSAKEPARRIPPERRGAIDLASVEETIAGWPATGSRRRVCSEKSPLPVLIERRMKRSRRPVVRAWSP